MLDKTQQMKFVQAGLEAYPDAKDTVEYFEESVFAALTTALESKVWRNVEPKKAKNQVVTSRARGTAPRALNTWIEGRVIARPEIAERRVFVFLAMMWNPPAAVGAKVALVASAGFERGSVPLLDLASRDAQVRLVKFKGSDARLVAKIAEFKEPWDALPGLLEALDDALGALASPQP